MLDDLAGDHDVGGFHGERVARLTVLLVDGIRLVALAPRKLDAGGIQIEPDKLRRDAVERCVQPTAGAEFRFGLTLVGEAEVDHAPPSRDVEQRLLPLDRRLLRQRLEPIHRRIAVQELAY